MSPIHSFQDLTIDLSRLGALELLGEPMNSHQCIVKLAFSNSSRKDSHLMKFSSYTDAQRMYDRIANKWMDFEQKKSSAKLVHEAEQELHF